MKKFRNVPALVTLLAGFVMAIFMILEKFTLMNFLWILVSVMIAFYVAGIVLRVILNKAFKDPETEDADDADSKDADNADDTAEENADTTDTAEDAE